MNKKRVLIIDDDPRNIFALTATLRAKNYECLSFTNAPEAIIFLKSSEVIDVILMDMMMPEMDGYEAISLIKTIDSRKKTLIVSVTAQAMLGDREKCLAAGADDYISKPIDVDKMLHILSKL